MANKIKETESIEIPFQNPFFEIGDDFILMAPSYEPEATEHANDFLDSFSNKDKLRGVIGVGNRNFADLFCYTAKDIAILYNVPYLYEFEFQGMEKDVECIENIVKNIKEGVRYKTPKELGYTGKAKSLYRKGEVEISKGDN